MDTSKIYIKMCEKAQEIQKDRFTDNGEGVMFITNGDYYFNNNSIKIFVPRTLKNLPFISQNNFIWLPRQDQLQEMIEIDDYLLEDLSRGMRLADYPHGWGLSDYYMHQFQTMEQLWLAEVMRSNHNKVWNQEKEEWEIKK